MVSNQSAWLSHSESHLIPIQVLVRVLTIILTINVDNLSITLLFIMNQICTRGMKSKRKHSKCLMMICFIVVFLNDLDILSEVIFSKHHDFLVPKKIKNSPT